MMVTAGASKKIRRRDTETSTNLSRRKRRSGANDSVRDQDAKITTMSRSLHDYFRDDDDDDLSSCVGSPPPLPIAVPTPVIATAKGGSSKNHSKNVKKNESFISDRSVPPLEGIDADEEDNENNSTHGYGSPVASVRTSFFGLPPRRRYLACALAMWLAELILVVALERFGLVEPEFRPYDAVKQMGATVKLPMQLELMLSRLNESTPLAYLTQEKKRPGFHLAQQGARAQYPVVMVPGFVTSGLEVWAGEPCARKHFRQRLWAALGGARSFLMERDCWKTHMMLDPHTGGDPDGIRLRAASGFEAADFFFGNYWVWGKLIENLADVGYTPSTMTMAPYDWRLAFPLLEERDGFFTKLKSTVEDMYKTTGKKVVLTSHSMGAQVVHHFFAWVTTSRKRGGGGGGTNWADKYIHAYVNIAGSHLGVPKAATALLSGEMSNTAIMGVMGGMVEQFFGRRLRRDLWITWGSLWAMLPQGGNELWGAGSDMCGSSRSSGDPFCPESGLSPFLAMADVGGQPQPRRENGPPEAIGGSDNNQVANDAACDVPRSKASLLTNFFSAKHKYLAEDVLDYLRAYRYEGGNGPVMSGSRLYSLYGREKASSRTWHDPTRTPLPRAPNMHIYCLYGTGLDTERAYYYRRNVNGPGDGADGEQTVATNNSPATNQTDDPPVILDTSVNNDAHRVKYGVRFTDGDGSVPLLSLGYLCTDAWTRRDSGLNPSMAPVTTREYKHQSEFVVDDPMRGGPRSADHVEILGNNQMTEDYLRIVTDFGPKEEVQKNRIVSDIEKMAADINSRRTKRRRRWWGLP